MGALSGIRVLDLSRILAGPWAAQILGDLGAEVLKVERPGSGDDTRHWGPPWLQDDSGHDTETAAYFLCANRNKRSVTIDITRAEGQALVRELAAASDVLIENYKLGSLARYGLDYDSLKAINPRLVYCSITGFGQSGPYAARAGYDFLIQGLGGLMSITGRRDDEPGGGPIKAGVALTDILTGLYAANAIQAALLWRRDSGLGQHIDMALLDVQVACLANQAMNFLTTGQPPNRLGNAHPNIVPYGSMFNTSDEKIIMLGVGNDAQFRQLCNALNCPEMAVMPDFSTNAARVNNRAEVNRRLAELIAQFDSEALLSDLQQRKVPAGGILSMPEVFEQPQGKELLLHGATQQGQSLIGVRSIAIEFDESQKVDLSPPPHLNQNGNTVLREFLGFSPEKIAELESRNVFGNI